MTHANVLQNGEDQALSEADLRQLIEAFKAAGTRTLDLRYRHTHLRLETPIAAVSEDARTIEHLKKQVTSPGVGTFHASRDWTPGTAVTTGTILGLLRSVSRETELRAGCDGTIVASLVAEGKFVAYGQPLFEIATGATLQGGPA